MTAALDKPHLTREHALYLLRQMIRIRQFEDKCAELYTQEKIRGFLHLYDGEEAVAVGVIPVLGEARPDRRDLSRARACARARRADDSGSRRDVWQAGGLQPRARRLHASVRSAPPISTAAMPSSAAVCRSRLGLRLPITCAARTTSRPAFLAKAP